MWVEAQRVMRQALSERLRTLPARLFAQLFGPIVQQVTLYQSSMLMVQHSKR